MLLLYYNLEGGSGPLTVKYLDFCNFQDLFSVYYTSTIVFKKNCWSDSITSEEKESGQLRPLDLQNFYFKPSEITL